MNQTTEATLSYFDYADHTIKVLLSMVSGKEQVYVDDKLVSERRSFRYSSIHHFQLDGKPAEVRIRVGSIFKGPYFIEFWLAGQQRDSDEWDLKRMLSHLKAARQQQPLWQRLSMYFLYGLVGGAVGALVGYSLATLLKG
ncbi:MAG: hypothetical protein AB1780_06970 [Pseudomonadota bacterium]